MVLWGYREYKTSLYFSQLYQEELFYWGEWSAFYCLLLLSKPPRECLCLGTARSHHQHGHIQLQQQAAAPLLSLLSTGSSHVVWVRPVTNTSAGRHLQNHSLECPNHVTWGKVRVPDMPHLHFSPSFYVGGKLFQHCILILFMFTQKQKQKEQSFKIFIPR